MYFADDDDFFAVDLSTMRAYVQGGRDAGTVVVRVYRAPRYGGPAQRQAFAMEPDGFAPDLALVGSGERALLDAFGVTPDDLVWAEHMRWTFEDMGDTIVIALAVGPDCFAVTVPRALVDGEATPPESAKSVRIEVNGSSLELSPDALLELVAAAREERPVEDPDLRERLEALLLAFEEPDAFAKAAVAMSLMLGDIHRAGLLIEDAGRLPVETMNCWWPCTGCALSLLGNVVAYASVLTSCGAALVTGGATAVGCILSIAGLEIAHASLMLSCAECLDCGKEPECPCEGEPLCDCK